MSAINLKRAERGWPLHSTSRLITETDTEGFRREVVFEPGHPWNTRNNPPSSNYGRGSLTIRFLLHGPNGSTQFLWSTGITPEMQPGTYRDEWMHNAPSGFDLGYHADSPQYEGQEPTRCEYRAAGECYYDGFGLAAEDVLRVFLTEGEDAMWRILRERHDGLEVSA